MNQLDNQDAANWPASGVALRLMRADNFAGKPAVAQTAKMQLNRLKPAIILSFVIALTGCVGGIMVWAAEPAQTASPAGATKQAPTSSGAIADSEIIPRAEQTINALQKIRSEVSTDSTLRSIQSDLSAAVEKADRRHVSDAESMSRIRSMQRVNDILREWTLERSQLDDWAQALAAKSQVLSKQENEVARITETWRATQAAVAKKLFFKAVLQRRIGEVLKAAQITDVAIKEQTTRLLKLQSQIADRLVTLGEIRKEIEQVKENLDRSLFKLDSPPLWQALTHREEPRSTESHSAEGVRRILDDLQAFAQKSEGRISLHLTLFLAILLLLRYFRRSPSPELVASMAGGGAIQFLNRPIASAFLLLLASSPLFYPTTAAVILRGAGVAAVIPIIRLVPGLLPNIDPRWVIILGALYALDFARYLLPQDWLLTRLLLLSTAVGGFLGLALFFRLRKKPSSMPSFSERLLILALWSVVGLFALSALSNVIGNLSLAEVLTATLLRIAFIAVSIFTCARLLTTVIALLLQTPAMRWLRSVREHGPFLVARCRISIGIVGIIGWFLVSLNILGILGDFFAAIDAFLELRWKLGAAEISIQDLFVFVAVLFGAFLISRLLRFVLTEEVLPRIRLPRGVPGAVDVLSRYGIMLLGFLIALAAAGVDFSRVTLLISALGVGVGFGLQNVVNNFVSGLILVFEHPVQVGDYVEVGGTFGEVRKIGFRASVLRTPDGAEIIVPNSELIGSRVTNWSLSDRLRRINISVGVAYGTDPQRVIAILMKLARNHPAVLSEPAPLAIFDRFGDSALNFTLLCWSYVDMFFLTRSELTIAINNAFQDAGIQIPFPQQDVHIHWSDEMMDAASPSEASKDAAQKTDGESTKLFTGEEPLTKK